MDFAFRFRFTPGYWKCQDFEENRATKKLDDKNLVHNILLVGCRKEFGKY